MNGQTLTLGRLLSEVLLLQRWAGGPAVPADRIFGLMNGFESTLKEESSAVDGGISRAVQDRVEDLLEEIDSDTASTNPLSVKDWLWREGIDETVAGKVMQLCRLQSRFPDVIQRIVDEPGSPFSYLGQGDTFSNREWFGSLHYMELIDVSGETEKKMHAVFAPTVPRVGEVVTPEAGEAMQVVDVEHKVTTIADDCGSYPILIPYVYLAPEEDDALSDVPQPVDQTSD